MVKSKVGDIESSQPMTMDAQGRPIIRAPIRQYPSYGPQSNAAPTMAPQGGPAPGATPVTAQAEGAPAATPAPTNAATQAAGGPGGAMNPVEVASLNPEAGAAEAAAQEKQTEGQQVPSPEVQQAAAQTESAPLARMAQAGPPPFIDPQQWNAYTYKKNYDIQQNLNEDAGKEENKIAFKNYDTLNTQAQQARLLMPNIDLAKAMLEDPRTHAGLLSGLQDVWSRFKEAALGQAGANAPNETFDKLLSGTILGNMKTALGGLGQIRLAEINLLQKANASRYYGLASNRAVLDITQRSLQRLDQLDSMANQYVNGQDVTDPITGEVLLPAGEGTRRGLDAGFNTIAQKWTNANPTYSKQEIANYNNLFEKGIDPATGQQELERGKEAPAQGGAQGGAPTPGTKKTFSDGKGGQVTGVWNGKSWVPENQYQPQAPVSK
jgi:hypothetical protein